MNHFKIPLNVPIDELLPNQMDIIKYGTNEEIEYTIFSKDNKKHLKKNSIEGLITRLARLFVETSSEEMRQ